MIKYFLFLIFPCICFSQKVIKSEKDILNIRIGDSYIVDGPANPIEFYAFLQTIEPLIDEHIKGLTQLSPLYLEIQECLRDHKLSTNANKFKVNDLRLYAIEVEGFTKEEISGIKKSELIELLQKRY